MTWVPKDRVWDPEIVGEYSNSSLCGDTYPGKYPYSIVTVQMSALSDRSILFKPSVPHSQWTPLYKNCEEGWGCISMGTVSVFQAQGPGFDRQNCTNQMCYYTHIISAALRRWRLENPHLQSWVQFRLPETLPQRTKHKTTTTEIIIINCEGNQNATTYRSSKVQWTIFLRRLAWAIPFIKASLMKLCRKNKGRQNIHIATMCLTCYQDEWVAVPSLRKMFQFSQERPSVKSCSTWHIFEIPGKVMSKESR